MELLEAACEVLRAANTPLHYKELCRRMVESKMHSPGGKDPAYTVYAKLYFDIRDNPQTRFAFPGRGVFSLIGQTVEDVREYVPTRVITQRNGKPVEFDPYKKLRKTIAEEHRKCVNCKYINWPDIEKLTRRSGLCDNYEESERLTVFAFDAPCAYWKQRSVEKMMADAREADVLRETVIKNNIVTQGSRRSA